MTGYCTQIQFTYTHAPCISPLPPCQHRDQPPLLSSHQLSQGDHLCKKKKGTTTAPQQPPTVSRRSLPQEEEEEKRTTTAAKELPTISRRPSPNEVQPLMIYPQQAHTALLKMIGKRPKKLEKPQVKPTYHKKKKTQSYQQQV